MFDIASSELLVVAIVALLVVGPKDLPKLMRTVGHWVRRARLMTGQFRAGFEQMMQEVEFQEERERIMKAHPNPAPEPTPTPGPATPGETVQTFSVVDSAEDGPVAPAVQDEAVEPVDAALTAIDQPVADQPAAEKTGASEHRS